MKRFGVCVLASVLSLAGCKKDISGSYLTTEKGSLLWLQLVRTPDSHVAGQIVFSDVKPDGQIEQKSAAVNGSVDAENVTLQVSSLLGLSNHTLSGTFDGKDITLAGADVPPRKLNRASLTDYQDRLVAQHKLSQELVAKKSADDASKKKLREDASFISDIDRMARQMQQFESEADVHLSRLPEAEKHYEAITTKVTSYITRQRQLAANPNASVTRGQLNVAANQAALDTDQIHDSVQSLRISLDTNIGPVAREASVLEVECHGVERAASKEDMRWSACTRLLSAVPAFDHKYDAIRSALNRSDEVYKREKSAQQRLLAESEKMD